MSARVETPAPTVASLLYARQDDDHPAILFEEEVLTWSTVVAECIIRAKLLATLAQPGRPQHIGVLLENTPEFVYWIGAAALGDAVVIGINPTRRGAELAQDITHTDCTLIVTDETGAAMLATLPGRPGTDLILRVDDPGYPQRLSNAEQQPPPSTAQRTNSALLLMFTSGSTGAPKAVICTDQRLARLAVSSAAGLGITRDDVLYESMPLFHGNAIMVNVLPALAVGATIALRRRFSASAFLGDVRRFGATYFNYVGRALAYILATPEHADDHDNPLRLGFGTEASARDIENFQRRFGCGIRENYGSSEGVIAIRRGPETPPDAMGVPPDAPLNDVIIADPATGRECPRAVLDERRRLLNAHEAIGEIVNRDGAARFEGYYRNPEATAARLRDGWYWSGDLGYRDAEGWFYFAGRDSDWLRVDSENFAASPIERILNTHPDVAVSAVYPVPDPQTGDQVMAALEVADPETFDVAKLWEFLGSHQDLGTKWCPCFVRLTAALPQTANGKLNKQPLRSEAWLADEPVFWQAERGAPYRRFTTADQQFLTDLFAEHGRTHLLPEAP